MCRNINYSILILILPLLLFLGGCAGKTGQPGFASVRQSIADRIGSDLHWHAEPVPDEQAASEVERMLGNPLTADTAAQIALLNNRGIQALYHELEISHADVIQAGLLRNPIFDASVLFPLDGGNTEINLGIRLPLLEAFLVPARKRVGESRFGETETHVIARVMDLAHETRAAFFQAQAAQQHAALMEKRVLAVELAFDFARRLRQAGNITELELHKQRDHYEKARLELRRAESSRFGSRERLNRLMGLWGERIDWEIEGELPGIPAEELENGPDRIDLESRVVEASLDLESARQRIVTAGHELGIQNATALVPKLELGAEAERNEDWVMGPTLSFPIPLFDQGQARRARGRAHLRRAQESYTALAIHVRSHAREAYEQYASARDIVHYYQHVILPLRERIVNETELQYHAMRVGPLEMLLAKEQEIAAGIEYVHAMKDYWIARARIEQMLSGRVPGDFNGMQPHARP